MARGGDGRPRRWRLLPDRRDGQPGIGGPRAREGRGRSRRALRAGDRGHGAASERRRPTRDRHRGGRPGRPRVDRGGGRRPRRRPVDFRAGPPGRRQRRALSGRARVGHDRADRSGHARPAVPARSRRLPLHPRLPRSIRRRGVRAERQADASRQGPDRRLRGARAGLGPLRAGPRPGSPSRAGPDIDRLCALPARARELHARLELPARVRAGGRRPVRRGGAQLPGHHLRARRRPGGRRVDRRWAPDDGPRRGRCRADRRLGQPAALAGGADGRIARRAVRHALARQAAVHGAWPAPAAARRGAPGGRRGDGPGRRMGTPALVRAVRGRRPGAGDRLRLRDAVVVPGGARGGSGHARGRRAVRPHDLREIPRRGAGRARRAPAPRDLRSRRRARADRLHGPRQRARRDRARPDDHPPGRRSVPRPGPDRHAASLRGPAPQRAAAGRCRYRRHLGVGDAPRRGARIPRIARAADRRRRLGGSLAVPPGPRDRRCEGACLGVPRLVHR